MTRTVLKVQGLDCADEASALRAALAGRAGLNELSFDYLRGEMTILHDESVVSVEDLQAAVSSCGFESQNCSACSIEPHQSKQGRSRRLLATTGSGACLLLGFGVQVASNGWMSLLSETETLPERLASVCFVLAAIIGSSQVAPKAWLAVCSRRLDMNVLMVVAVVGAIGLKQFSEAASVSFLFCVSLTLESWSVSRARRAVETLMTLAPETAYLLQADGSQSIVSAQAVRIGDRLLVRPGDRVPVDGTVMKGETTINQAPITGESVPVVKSPGDDVFAGTINQDGAIEIAATQLADDSTLSRIVALVADSQRKRAPTEQWVESFARIYTPLVIGLAILVMLVPVVTGGSWSQWLYQGLVLLVIACPCALVISTPVSFVAGLASAAHHGVLVKGAGFLESMSKLRVLAFDKTGTLTVGRPTVKEVVPLSGHTEREVLNIAAAIEAQSQHPLAEAIVAHAQGLGLPLLPVENFQSLTGKGATATFAGEPVWIGSHRAFEQRGAEPAELHQLMEQLAARGRSIVVIAAHGHVCGLIALGDEVRRDAKPALQHLQAAGVQRLVMLTGDNAAAAASVALAVGIQDVRAELLPADKVTAIEELIAAHRYVGMIGDGVNDAPAMARATLGIAMGAVGTDTALETADIALMTDDLSRLGWLVQHSHRTLSIVRQNITASLAVKAVFVLLTFAGYSNLWTAIMADTGVSLLVVFNALRLLPSRN